MSVDLRALVSPATTALLIQEGQRGVIGDESALPELSRVVADAGAIGKMARLTGAARAAGVPVVHATAENPPGGFGVNRNARPRGGVGVSERSERTIGTARCSARRPDGSLRASGRVRQ